MFDVDGDEITLISDLDLSKSDPRKASGAPATLSERAG